MYQKPSASLYRNLVTGAATAPTEPVLATPMAELAVPLLTERLSIRPLEHADLPGLMPYYSNADFLRYLPNPIWHSMADAEHWYSRVAARHLAGTSRHFVILDTASTTILGLCMLFNFDAPSERAELGYALGPQHWGLGIMREALTAFIFYALTTGGLRKLDATIDPRNHASRKVLEHFGFRPEGHRREHVQIKGELLDTLLYGLIRRQWLSGLA